MIVVGARRNGENTKRAPVLVDTFAFVYGRREMFNGATDEKRSSRKIVPTRVLNVLLDRYAPGISRVRALYTNRLSLSSYSAE